MLGLDIRTLETPTSQPGVAPKGLLASGAPQVRVPSMFLSEMKKNEEVLVLKMLGLVTHWWFTEC